MTSFRGRTIIVLLLCVIFGILAFYSKFVTTFPTGSVGHNLTRRFNPVSVVIFNFYTWIVTTDTTGFLASLLLPLLTLLNLWIFQGFTIFPTSCGMWC